MNPDSLIAALCCHEESRRFMRNSVVHLGSDYEPALAAAPTHPPVHRLAVPCPATCSCQ